MYSRDKNKWKCTNKGRISKNQMTIARALQSRDPQTNQGVGFEIKAMGCNSHQGVFQKESKGSFIAKGVLQVCALTEFPTNGWGFEPAPGEPKHKGVLCSNLPIKSTNRGPMDQIYVGYSGLYQFNMRFWAYYW